MNTAVKLSFALLISLSFFGVPSSADAATKAKSGRQAALKSCRDETYKMYPGRGPQVTVQRTAAYKACMTRLGYKP